MTSLQLRKVTQNVTGYPTTDGAGVRMSRIIGSPELKMLDPFLLLDEFRSDEPQDYIAGFPDHPHRGFETVTYMLAGRVRHADNAGHKGTIKPGDVQWMTAGRGIIHSEMPEQIDGEVWGFQLWINLPAKQKMCAPSYKEIIHKDIPIEIRENNVILKVITGITSQGTQGPITNVSTAPIYYDIKLPLNTEFIEAISHNANAFIYVYEGQASVVTPETSDEIKQGMLAVIEDGNAVHIVTRHSSAKLLLIAAQPINEPVARGGPFVMNTREELQQAFADYELGRF